MLSTPARVVLFVRLLLAGVLPAILGLASFLSWRAEIPFAICFAALMVPAIRLSAPRARQTFLWLAIAPVLLGFVALRFAEYSLPTFIAGLAAIAAGAAAGHLFVPVDRLRRYARRYGDVPFEVIRIEEWRRNSRVAAENPHR